MAASFYPSVKAPLAIGGTAGCSFTRDLAVAAIGGFGKIAALRAGSLEFSGWLEVTASLAMVPGIAAANIAIQAVGISAERIRLIVAVYVLRHGVADQSA